MQKGVGHDLPAGMELDALIAEKVIGMHSAEVADWIRLKEHNYGIPHYSTDIAAAWEVVDNLIERKFRVSVLRDFSEWAVCIWLPNAVRWTDAIEADTAPHAICLAALNAVGAL